MDFSSWGPAEWSAVGTFLTVVVGGGIALAQLIHIREVEQQKSRPYVIVDFEFRGIAIYLTIRNIGATMARDVRIKFDHPLVSTFPNSAVGESRVFRDPIPMIAPGRTISFLFDSFPERYAKREEFPMEYTVTIEYEDAEGKPYTDPPYPLDLGTYDQSAVSSKGLPEIVREVEKIRKEMAKWTSGVRGILVHSVDHEQQTRRSHRPWVRRTAAQVRREQGLRAYARWQVDRQLRRYGWRR
ncbi:hypothetical protein ACH4OY_15635 [Micromonospora rubida]|uniref:DUF4352 domain-containing protein n=1 Tax=Micromonospora rubida TaxID=2697657 RepID=A0ABW7SK97_9ACTN